MHVPIIALIMHVRACTILSHVAITFEVGLGSVFSTIVNLVLKKQFIGSSHLTVRGASLYCNVCIVYDLYRHDNNTILEGNIVYHIHSPRTQALGGRRKKEPGTHRLRLRVIYPEFPGFRVFTGHVRTRNVIGVLCTQVLFTRL